MGVCGTSKIACGFGLTLSLRIWIIILSLLIKEQILWHRNLSPLVASLPTHMPGHFGFTLTLLYSGGHETRLSLLMLTKVSELHILWPLDQERVIVSLIAICIFSLGEAILTRYDVDIVSLNIQGRLLRDRDFGWLRANGSVDDKPSDGRSIILIILRNSSRACCCIIRRSSFFNFISGRSLQLVINLDSVMPIDTARFIINCLV